METSFLSGLLQNISSRGRSFLGYPRTKATTPDELLKLANALISGRGEATGVALASDILSRYASLSADDRTEFLLGINDQFGPDLDKIHKAIEAYQKKPDARNADALHAASEPKRQELIRRLNLAPNGTYALVKIREDVQARLKAHPTLAALDQDFIHLFSSWFNRGFLVLRRIDWSTPANILEKIIHYEAVHAIESWDDLRRRLEPNDRRLYAFFHPALVDEPLIFVEVALMADIPNAIAPLLTADSGSRASNKFTTAVFYSISNAQPGLAGVSFGNFLIKQVVEELKREMSQLETFVTLSPVPGFAKWLLQVMAEPENPLITSTEREILSHLNTMNWIENPQLIENISKTMLPLAAHYFLIERDKNGRASDPVSRFHLGNGARLERLNMIGDRSKKGLHQSYGLMVNYLYDLTSIEANHEAYVGRGDVIASPSVRKLLPPSSTNRALTKVFSTKDR